MCEVAEKIYEQGEMEKARKIALNMHKDGIPEDLIAKYVNVSIDLVKKWLGLSIA